MNLVVTNKYETRQNIYQRRNRLNAQPTFRGPLDGALTATLRTLDTNEMANAVLLDVGAMVLPRTYIDTKKRNKNAGAETFFREISGTFINCLSAGIFSSLIAMLAVKRVKPNVFANPKSWFSDDSITILKKAWDKGTGNVKNYVKNVFENMNGKDGKNLATFNNINWDKVEWFNENKWNKYVWDNPKYQNIEKKLTTKDGFIETFSEIIEDKNLSNKDKRQIFGIMETRLTNALGVGREVKVTIGEDNLVAPLNNIIRDTYDMGKDVFTNEKVDTDLALEKIKKINKIKIFGALSLASALGLTNQRLNRKITEKRTGKKGFAGDPDYEKNNLNNAKNSNLATNNNKALKLKKILASLGMIGMTIGVMRVKNPKDFIKKLQFTGPISTGNAIKTVYASTIVGRFMAADSENELRESVVRDYFGFLNWLVFGGFVAKGVGNLLDRNREIFNIHKEGKGVRHWLNDINLKTHAEIVAKGKTFAKKNLWKLNVAHIAGLAYSTVALGIILPLINIKMANNKKFNPNANIENNK